MCLAHRESRNEISDWLFSSYIKETFPYVNRELVYPYILSVSALLQNQTVSCIQDIFPKTGATTKVIYSSLVKWTVTFGDACRSWNMCFTRLSSAEYNSLSSPTHTHSEKINSGVFIEQLSLPLNSKEALCCPPADLLNFPPVFFSFVMMKAFPFERTERLFFFIYIFIYLFLNSKLQTLIYEISRQYSFNLKN